MSTRSVALLSYLLFVVYGSLVPLDYRPVPLDEAWQRFLHTPFLSLGVGSRADWIANGVLYVPLAALAAQVARHSGRVSWAAAALGAWTLCVALAFAVEFAQLSFPPRTVSQNDLIAEALGSAIGVALAPFASRWLERLRQAWRAGGSRRAERAMEAYAVLVVVLSFFPYDVLLSGDELAAKVASQQWGWLLAPSGRSLLVTLVQLAVEAAIMVPFGVLVARLRRSGPVSPGAAALLGAVLGLVMEAGQFLIASGISQGASVLSRAAGLALGVGLSGPLERGGMPWVRAQLGRFGPLVLLVYAPALAGVNGWFRGAWHGVEAAAATWSGVRLMPFYYHYYSTEAVALASLLSVAVMYLPLAAVGWARRWPAAVTLVAVGIVALVIESAKLFLAGQHPDPTNVLIALAAATAMLRLVGHGSRPPRPEREPPVHGERHGGGLFVVLPALAAAAVCAATFPAFRGLLLAVLALAAVAVWRRPALALALAPAAVPVLDFAPWTGRIYWTELDLLLLVCLAVALHRSAPGPDMRAEGRLARAAFALLALSLGASTLRAVLPWAELDANAWSSYLSPLNALRIVKGAVWAWLFTMLWRRHADAAPRLFGAGMLVGLAWTVAWVIWERAAFVGLLDFSSAFRVSGPISAMHRGGAFLECYVSVAAAFAMVATLQARGWPGRVAGLALLAGAGYATMVTFSRNGYVALAAALVVGLAGVAGARGTRRAPVWVGALAVVVVVALSWPIVTGPLARERLSRTLHDLAVRQEHWSDALRARQDDLWTTVFGEGIGRFPDVHFWRSQETVRAGSYRLVREGSGRFLRLGPGATLYIEQVIDRLPGGNAQLKVDVRSRDGQAELAVALCMKWLLTSLKCENAVARADPHAAGTWRTAVATLDLSRLAGHDRVPRPPLKMALLTPSGRSAIDIDNVRLLTAEGVDLLDNGDFSAGMDRWFFTTDSDPPWHIHSLPVALLFDQGWFGVMAALAVLAASLAGAVRSIRAGRPAGVAAAAGLAAFLASGTLNTLIDDPRFLWLLLVLAWLCSFHGGPEDAASGTRRTRPALDPRIAGSSGLTGPAT